MFGRRQSKGWIELERDVQAITIPNGDELVLEEGEPVVVQQELGDTFTLRTQRGYLVRIEGTDADAIGRETPEAVGAGASDKPLEERVWVVLKTCYDPEIPIDIVELGLIYDVQILERDDDEKHDVYMEMTLTAPGCGMGDILANDAKHKIEAIEDVEECMVQIVFDPPWTPDKLSDEARLELGLI